MNIKQYLILGAVVALIGVFMFSGENENKNLKQSTQENITMQKKSNDKEITSSTQQHTQYSKVINSKIQTNKKTGFIRVQNTNGDLNKPINYQQNIPNYIYKQQIAKQRYEREQIQRAQVQKAQKSRSNYYTMQRVMSNRTPSMVKSNEEYIQNRYVRAQVAKNEYIQQQQKMQQQMKMRSKLERMNNR